MVRWTPLLSPDHGVGRRLAFYAAQTGFLSGPRVMANMALDRWLPRRFTHLSQRLVMKDGILVMDWPRGHDFLTPDGLRARAHRHVQHQRVSDLTLSQLGMVRQLAEGKSGAGINGF